MIIDIKDILTLDDNNDYVVISKTTYESKTYYYLVDNNNNSNLKFCYQDNDTLVEIKNASLLKEIIPLLSNSNTNN